MQSLPGPQAFNTLPSFHSLKFPISSLQDHLSAYIVDSDNEEKQMSSHLDHQGPPWKLYGRPVAFARPINKKHSQKINKKYRRFSCFGDFLRFGKDTIEKQGLVAIIGMFFTRGDAMLGAQSQDIIAHAWVTIYARTYEGYELWIFDPSLGNHLQAEEVRIYEFEKNMQHNMQPPFISYCEGKFNTTFNKAWIKGRSGERPFWTGFQQCTEFIQQLMQPPWSDWPWTPAKSRSLGFLPLVSKMQNSNPSSPGASSDHDFGLPEDCSSFRIRATPSVRRRSASPAAGPLRRKHRRESELPTNVLSRNEMASKSTQTVLEGKDLRYVAGYMFSEAQVDP